MGPKKRNRTEKQEKQTHQRHKQMTEEAKITPRRRKTGRSREGKRETRKAQI